MDENHMHLVKENKRSKMKIPLLVKMMRTRWLENWYTLCQVWGVQRTEKKIIKGIKDHVQILLLINVEVLLGNVLKKHMDIERVV
ncbi:hypothetical protein HPP92_010395 [Vanilla planifolia]|uniref:Uncharacterized protein n=1 Tax=Vanilla planifolia TaxID=51239 RepID=A0A835R408_VANPL|nr:hypothetical protein HPP92_010395 [Vanilla planifolia]